MITMEGSHAPSVEAEANHKVRLNTGRVAATVAFAEINHEDVDALRQ